MDAPRLWDVVKCAQDDAHTLLTQRFRNTLTIEQLSHLISAPGTQTATRLAAVSARTLLFRDEAQARYE